MKLLLDTHIWLWSQLDPAKLGKKITRALQSPDNEIWVSPISVWEFLLLVEKKRITVSQDPHDWVELAWSRAPLREASLNRQVAKQSRLIQVPHQDPADRFIAATAAVFDLTLVTQDTNLLAGRGYKKLAS